MSITEKVFEELNECRTNPSKYSQKLAKTLKFYRGKVFERPGSEAIETEEGTANVQACISYMKSITAIAPLEHSPGLTLAAQLHADDIGPSGRMSHIGEDGSEPSDRIEKYCQWSGHLGENIDYGNSSPEDIVVSLLVDDGVLARGQRLNIMKKEHKYVGIGFSYHSEHEYVCVIVFTELVIENSFSSIPSKLGPKKIQRSEYVQNKEITEEQSKLLEEKINKKKIKKGQEATNTITLQKYYDNTQFTQDEIIEIKEFFDRLDHDSSGTVTGNDLKRLACSPDISNSSLDQIIMSINPAKLVTLDFDGFFQIISQSSRASKPQIPACPVSNPSRADYTNEVSSIFPISHKFSNEMISEIKGIFDKFDNEKSGMVDVSKVKEAVERHEMDSYNSTILDLMIGLDTTKNQQVDFGEFVEIISEIEDSSADSSNEFAVQNRTSLNKSKSRKLGMSAYESHYSRKSEKVAEEIKTRPFRPEDYEKPGVTTEQIIEIKKAFDLFDLQKKGTISTRDLKRAMEDQGFQRKNPIVYELICDIDLKKSGEMDFEKFFKVLTETGEGNDSDHDIKKFFDLFDIEKVGYIELKNLKRITKELGDIVDDEDLIDLIKKSDLDGDGKVSYQDFYKILSKVT